MIDISIVGGIAIDIEGRPYDALQQHESNPGVINISHGGVGRNIAENAARMGANTAFISVVGGDSMGINAVKELEKLGINTDKVKFLKDEKTAIYLSILNHDGDMDTAICNMSILEKISTDVIDSALPVLRESRIVGMDANLTEEIQRYLLNHLEGTPVFFDPVSAPKSQRAKKHIGKFHTVKPNAGEASILSDIEINNEDDLCSVGRFFMSRGVKRVFITLNAKGVFYMDEKESGIIAPPKVDIVSATGAGDAFSAALMKSFVEGCNTELSARYGMAASRIALESKAAVNPKMSIGLMEKYLNE